MNRTMSFTPRSLTASEYVLALFEPDSNVAVLLRDRPTRQTLQRIAKADVVADPSFQSWLKSRNLAGSDIFVGMNPIREGAYSRTKQNIKEIRHVYLDLDRHGDTALQAIRASREVPPPNFVLHTSPGKHQVVWRVDGLNLEEAESLLHNLARGLGGDPAATDATRVLRLPGFRNHKLQEQFVVQAIQEANEVHSARDFALPEESQAAPRHVGDTAAPARPVANGHKSQSELDWAFALRALSRGDDPEVVIERIADYRAHDKSDPEYYARHTVTKAVAELKSRGAAPADSSLLASDSSREPDH